MNITGVVISDDMDLLDLGFDALGDVIETALMGASVTIEGMAVQREDFTDFEEAIHEARDMDEPAMVVIEFTAQGGSGDPAAFDSSPRHDH
jgi:hypothetical protein